MYHFVAVDCGFYVPEYDCVTIYFLKDIMTGVKKCKSNFHVADHFPLFSHQEQGRPARECPTIRGPHYREDCEVRKRWPLRSLPIPPRLTRNSKDSKGMDLQCLCDGVESSIYQMDQRSDWGSKRKCKKQEWSSNQAWSRGSRRLLCLYESFL